MKRRNFFKVLTAAAATVALPASAMRDILIHKGNLILPHGVAKAEAFSVMYGAGPYYYQREALRQMNLYQHASRVVFPMPRHAGKTYWLDIGNRAHKEIEMRVLAALNTKQKRA